MAAREDVLRAMDREIHPYSVDRVFNKDGTVSKSVGWAVEEQALARLCDRAVEIAGDLCERIRSGEMDASPTSDGLGPVCRYCDYHSLCRVRRGSERTLDQTMTWQDAAGTDAREGTREAGPAEA